MEKRIFEGAKFGDIFLTRDGRKAILVTKSKNGYVCSIQRADGGLSSVQTYYDDYGHRRPYAELDIVSRYHEQIDEEKLDTIVEYLLDDAYLEDGKTMARLRKAAEYGCKIGYRAAIENTVREKCRDNKFYKDGGNCYCPKLDE